MATSSEQVRRNVKQSKSGTRIVAADGSTGSVFDFGEPPWIADAEVPRCEACSSQFSFFLRKHHCRFCGHIFCGKCCDHAVPSARQGFVDPVRLCAECIPVVKKDNDFMSQKLHVLTEGATFVVDGTPVLCKISESTHSSLELGESHKAIKLLSITKVEDIRADASSPVTGITLKYKGDSGASEVQLLIDVNDPCKKKTLVFIGALKKGLQALHGPTPSSPHKK